MQSAKRNLAVQTPIPTLPRRTRGEGRIRRSSHAPQPSRAGRGRGIAILELMLVLPILLMLSFGLVDYGYFFYLKSTVQGAGEAGARAAIVTGAANSDVATAVTSVMSLAGIPAANYTVTTVPTDITTAATGTYVSVTVSCSWGTVGYHALPVFMGGISNSKQLAGAGSMRRE
ncbi:MAG TPA: TadE/TadG family type IV pilus assembly protein [Tepidisphaeraceae bacterium]|nr:TadE/TadG family type IV pilus assembly protein [Tepidisphaeraceae bacterium]